MGNRGGRGGKDNLKLAVLEKSERLRRGTAPRVLDLFSGCGGLFLGFQRAGCESVGGVEIDPIASLSYANNFHRGSAAFDAHAKPVDITTADPIDLLQSWGIERPQLGVDIIVGGPPCPAFARVGRAKLREIHDHPEAFRQDPRAKLYLPYLRFVESLAPVAMVMENVPDILNYGDHNLGEEICESLEELGYNCTYTLLNAASYGVPQMRERFFLMAVHKSINRKIEFPTPICRVKFPPGYEGSRQVALKHLRDATESEPMLPARRKVWRFSPTPEVPADARNPVTVEEALRDLLPITAHLTGQDRRGARKFTTGVEYREDVRPSRYALEMRSWPGFEAKDKVYDHVTRCLSDRDYRLFREMKEGDDYPKAHDLAQALFRKALARKAKHGEPIVPGTAAYRALEASYVPPYDPHKFPNKWRKMEPDLPARTLMAHLGKDTYSHIHYDSDQARVISVREAARLQSFPDGFTFSGTMNPAFRQIGNSVPPLLSFAIAKSVISTLGLKVRERTSTNPAEEKSGLKRSEELPTPANRVTG